MSKALTIVSLNCWGGRFMYNLSRFVVKYRDSVDVFCFQEVFDADQYLVDLRHPGEYLRGTMFSELVHLLPDHFGIFAAQPDPHHMSLAMFVRKGVEISDVRNEEIFSQKKPVAEGGVAVSSRHIQSVTLRKKSSTPISIANFHGMWTGGGKGDTPERIIQSECVSAFLSRINKRHVIVGDFNLEPDTVSLRMLNVDHFDLIDAHGVVSTRTPLYRKWGDGVTSLYADYAFVSPGVDVEHFEVLPDLASDHAALLVEVV